jgi:hypothetical protein
MTKYGFCNLQDPANLKNSNFISELGWPTSHRPTY